MAASPYRLLVIGVLGALLLPVFAAADEKSAEEALKGKGLRRMGTSFVLPAEAEVGKRLRDAEALKKKLGAAQRELGFWQQKVECAILPEQLPGAAPLLGLSFFKHFTYKIDTANSKLVMSKVQAEDQPSPGSRTRKKPVRSGR